MGEERSKITTLQVSYEELILVQIVELHAQNWGKFSTILFLFQLERFE